MEINALHDDIDLYIWEGSSDIGARAERCLAGFEVAVLHVDPAATPPAARDPARRAVAMVSATVMDGSRFPGLEWLKAQAVPVIWVASEDRGHDPRFYPPAYSHTLPLSFTCAELRAMVMRLGRKAGEAAAAQASGTASRAAMPLVAVSPVMRALLDEARMFADCGASVLVHGETGVGKERVARLLHDASSWASGPFVAVNCGAVPEGLFEAHFFGHAKGAFTGAVGAHKGYFEQADGGTLFLDEIGDLPPYQQVKLLRVLEQSAITRLGSTTEIPVRFRLVSATNRDLRTDVAQGRFRADLFFRLAVVELDVPNLEQRGPEEKAALFAALVGRDLPDGTAPAPQWLLDHIGGMQFHGNVRELANLAERISIVYRQAGDWDRDRIGAMLQRFGAASATAVAMPAQRMAGDAMLDAASASDEAHGAVESQERERILDTLRRNGWRRQDSAAALGISRKVLWEKMRRFGISDHAGDAAV